MTESEHPSPPFRLREGEVVQLRLSGEPLFNRAVRREFVDGELRDVGSEFEVTWTRPGRMSTPPADEPGPFPFCQHETQEEALTCFRRNFDEFNGEG